MSVNHAVKKQLHREEDIYIFFFLNRRTHQLEVCHSHRALLIHLLLVFVLNQTVHQLAGVNLVISHLLADRRRKKTFIL